MDDLEQSLFLKSVLSQISDSDDADSVTFNYDRLTIEHTIILSLLPLYVIHELASIFQEEPPKLDIENNDKMLKYFKDLSNKWNIAIYQDVPFRSYDFSAELFLLIVNYISLYAALTNNLLCDDDLEVIIEEPHKQLSDLNIYDLSTKLYSGFYKTLTDLLYEYVETNSRLVNDKKIWNHCVSMSLFNEKVCCMDFNLSNREYPIRVITNKSNIKALDVGVHVPDHAEYQLWVRFYIDIPGKEVDLLFIPLWDRSMHREALLSAILDLEIDILYKVNEIKSEWSHFMRRPGPTVLKDESVFLKWIEKVLGSETSSKIFFEHSPLRRALMTLDSEVQTSEKISEMARNYTKRYRDYLPLEVTQAMREALPEVDLILAQVRGVPLDKIRPRAIKYMKSNHDRFRVITVAQVRDALKVFDLVDKGHASRDFRESILSDVARSFGRLAPKTSVIRQFIAAEKSSDPDDLPV